MYFSEILVNIISLWNCSRIWINTVSISLQEVATMKRLSSPLFCIQWTLERQPQDICRTLGCCHLNFMSHLLSAVSYEDNDVLSSGWSPLWADVSFGNLLGRGGHRRLPDLSVLGGKGALPPHPCSLGLLWACPCLRTSKLKEANAEPIQQQRDTAQNLSQGGVYNHPMKQHLILSPPNKWGNTSIPDIGSDSQEKNLPLPESLVLLMG